MFIISGSEVRVYHQADITRLTSRSPVCGSGSYLSPCLLQLHPLACGPLCLQESAASHLLICFSLCTSSVLHVYRFLGLRYGHLWSHYSAYHRLFLYFHSTLICTKSYRTSLFIYISFLLNFPDSSRATTLSVSPLNSQHFHNTWHTI